MNAKRAIVLIVDEAPDYLIRMNGQLQDRYEVRLANSGRAALMVMEQVPRPDLLVLSTELPDIDGYRVCQQLKSSPDTADIPLLLVQAEPDEARALGAGAVDVIARPFAGDVLRARVETHLQLRHARELLKQQRNLLEHVVEEVTAELSQMLDAMIWALASLAETREYETANHLRRVQHYVVALARRLQGDARFAEELSDANIKALYKAAPLHDIGKVSIPDAILLKPGPLTPAEFSVMKMHTVYGRDAIVNVENHLGYTNTFLRYAREITYSHQEKYDGSGYPEGLRGEAIPLAARLMAVADVYDALISKRVYKPAFTHETAVEMVRQASGEHFDPDVVDAMLVAEEEFRDIAERYADTVQDLEHGIGPLLSLHR
ncbi:two-component system response regulator [Duganella sp. Leaf126]|uniref:HD-GYP domain-containing protein n=1 Tax=Duganella sp. Leaf126 TaxID=1736266 RepID=UPI0006F6CB35|nr:HD domain-containing phosphohydrolase [Duganella sp. Leaf126]KQQ33602.1 two-component system response regulator [Duganella sp. Leaf126]